MKEKMCHIVPSTKYFVLCFLLMGSVWSFYACSKANSQQQKNKIMVSIEPLRFFTEQIAGGNFEVQSIVPDGYNPEDYKPTPEQLIALNHCKTYFKIGQLGFETTWLEKACQNQPELQIVDTSDSIHTHSSGIKMAEFDPHTWTSAQNAILICKTICATLCKLDSVNADTYQKNLQKTIEEIQKTDLEISNLLKNLPSRTFITVHPSLTYFAHEYGLKQLPIENEGKEPTPTDIKNLIKQSKQDSTYAILVQKQFARSQAEIIAKETGAKIKYINPLGYNWNNEMIVIAKALQYDK